MGVDRFIENHFMENLLSKVRFVESMFYRMVRFIENRYIKSALSKVLFHENHL
jgi:hypothetical protein